MKGPTIQRFYAERLGASFKSNRWSWGARDLQTNRVFLRVWSDGISVNDGREVMRLFVPNREATKSHGYGEREDHLGLITGGFTGFGVLCHAADTGVDGARRISSFDSEQLLRFGRPFIGEDGATYAVIEERVPVSSLTRPTTGASTVAQDVLAAARSKVDRTEREALVAARVGQGVFRAAVLDTWGKKCAVTGIALLDVVRASHIKPWRLCSNTERLDPENGLPLVATLDALFDARLISFSSEGKLLISLRVDQGDQVTLGLGDRDGLLREPSTAQQSYLEFHRKELFLP